MMNKNNFNLIMVSAMYENGGNTLHRFLDGHPQLYVYPFESQPGTPLVSDYLTSVFPQKYRWPQFSLTGNFSDDYELIIDEEFKRHIKTPFASKFKDANIQTTDSERKKAFLDYLKSKNRTRKNIIEAYFFSTFKTWKNYKNSGKELAYVGYSPIIGVDADKIFYDFPNSHVLHIVRNPFSAYADTKKRPVPYDLPRYIHTWSIVQLMALNFSKIYPENFHILKFEDLIENTKNFFSVVMKKLDLNYSKTLEYRSWNGKKLDNLVPWGTIQKATTKANIITMKELSEQEYEQINKRTRILNKILNYDKL